MFTVNRNPSAAELRKFGWAMLLGFTVLAGIAWWVYARKHDLAMTTWNGGGGQLLAVILLGLGIVLGVIGVAMPPAVSRPVYVAWMTLTIPFGTVMSTVMLTLLFVILLPFFSLLIRFGDPLRKRLGAGSYWEDYKHYEPTMERMRRPF